MKNLRKTMDRKKKKVEVRRRKRRRRKKRNKEKIKRRKMITETRLLSQMGRQTTTRRKPSANHLVISSLSLSRILFLCHTVLRVSKPLRTFFHQKIN